MCHFFFIYKKINRKLNKNQRQDWIIDIKLYFGRGAFSMESDGLD